MTTMTNLAILRQRANQAENDGRSVSLQPSQLRILIDRIEEQPQIDNVARPGFRDVPRKKLRPRRPH